MDEDKSEEMLEVADPAQGVEEQVAAEPVNEEPVVEEETSEKTDADTRFAQMRRELEAKEANEQQYKAQMARVTKALEPFGFTGQTPDEIADAAEAHTSGRTVEEVKAERLAKQQETSEVQKLRNEAEFYRQREYERVLAEDLKTVQALDPTIKDLKELGNDFFKLKAQGVDTEIAFNAVNAKRKANEVTPPPKAGKVNAKTQGEKEFYTPEEVDRLTEKDLDDPKVYQRVMKSMTKW